MLLSGQQAAGTAFTAAQAAAGRTTYQAQCATCHLPDLKGSGDAAPLAGSEFMDAWGRRTTRELLSFMQLTMPPSRPGALSQEEYLNIAAFILQTNGAPAGTTRSRRPSTSRSTRSPGPGSGGRRGAAGTRRASGGPGRRRWPRPRRGRPARRHHGRRRSEELRPGHRRDAAQSRSERLAHDPPRLPRVELQPAESDHGRQREGSAAAVDLGDERRRRQSARAARAQRRHLSQQPRQHPAGDRRQDRRSDLGEPLRQQRERRRDARHRDLRRQDLHGDQRRAPGGVRRADRQDGLGHDDRRSLEGQLQHEQRSARRQGQGDPGPGRLPDLPRREMLHQRVRRGHRQGAVAVLHHRHEGRARRRHLGHAARICSAPAASRGSPAATIRC